MSTLSQHTIPLPWRKRRPPGRVGGPEVMTSLTEKESETLADLAVGKRVLEVGAAYGYSSLCMAPGASVVYSVDHHQHLASLSLMEANLRAYGLADKVVMIVGSSRTVLPLLPNAYFDLVFIDGDHGSEGVRFDAEHANLLVKPGGVIAFHDYNEASCVEVAPTLDAVYNTRGWLRRLVDTLLLVQRPESGVTL